MTTKAPRLSKKPILIKRGSVTLKIYCGVNLTSGVSYDQFTLVYYEGAQRKKKNFASVDEAKREAELVAAKLSKGEGEVLRLTATDRAVYLQALEQLRPFKLPLNVAVLEYTSALKHLPEGAALKEAVDFFSHRNPASFAKSTVRQVADEMLAAKRAANLSPVHLKDLDCRLNRFADDFQMNIGGVSGTMIQAWLDAMKRSGRTKINYLRVIASLFRFAIRRKYLPKDAYEEVESVQQAKEDSGEIEIFTPEEMLEILTAARSEIVPWLAIAAFSGLRTAEIYRLDWSEVNMAQRHIEIIASKAKTATRRLAPLTDNLAAWLTPYAQHSGQLTDYSSWWNQFIKLAREVNRLPEERGNSRKFAWKHNALRHSFISYRVAATQNVAQVALEAGNSPQMVFRNYRQLVTPAEAEKWFAIVPATKGNMVPMRSGAAAT